jgi:hypothetical protein
LDRPGNGGTLPVERFAMKTLWIVPAILASACLVCAAPKSAAKPAPKSAKPAALAGSAGPTRGNPILDTAKIRSLYLDGDFENAIEILEAGLKEKRPFVHGDSVFIFKHLGVMYAAKYDTREKGKYYMHQLLATEPTAKIMDMYASDMIYMIFKNIQDEFESTRVKMDRAESNYVGNTRANNSDPASTPEAVKPKESGSGNAALYWVGAGVVTAGVAAYFLLAEEPKTVTTTNKHIVP